MMIHFKYSFNDITSLENLLSAWQEFLAGKKGRKDVKEFPVNLFDNILLLHNSLANKTYRHSGYEYFKIADPKPRDIHKASVRDRLLHHAIYRQLYPFFERMFIADSFSCQLNKGTHKAVRRFKSMANCVSRNNTRACWVLQCDIKKFFASIDHGVLLKTLNQYIPNKDIMWLLEEVIGSFSLKPQKGLPLGNLTSQLFVNVYMNSFDQFVKHKLKAKFYCRYADDFVIVHEDRTFLKGVLVPINRFLNEELLLKLHPNKVNIRKYSQGIDFLGYIIFPHHIVLRTKTKRRMYKKVQFRRSELEYDLIDEESFYQTLQSYLGILKHCESYKNKLELFKIIKDSDEIDGFSSGL